ncbi:MAG: hypothetical protein JNJ58_08790 [Chitinophagaceae bacterium]|nr:hypothetical protein [Chitinophagaceae bacterium]
MKYILLFNLILLSCQVNSEKKHERDTPSTVTAAAYAKAIKSTDSLKAKCRLMYWKDAGQCFSTFIENRLLPAWYGTVWDFNGTTQVPGEGKIACGYFVTTVLRDAGVDLHRVKMAQCASEMMINHLTQDKEYYNRISFADFIRKVKSHGPGLSVIGLDNHTGFLLYDGEELYFIHASYIGTGKVAKDIAEENIILKQSAYKVVGYLSQSEGFVRRWMGE